MLDGSFEQKSPCAMNISADPTDKPGKPAPRDGWRKWLPRTANLALWLLFCAMSATGLLLAFRLPPGSRGGHGLSVLGWSRHEWGDLHLWISYSFLALILLHLCLHWRWFWQIAGKRRAWPILAGIGAGLALAISAFCIPVEREKTTNHGKPSMREGNGPGRAFRGGRE